MPAGSVLLESKKITHVLTENFERSSLLTAITQKNLDFLDIFTDAKTAVWALGL